ncbi:lysylphosphatidylglycerol synthase transmembrane domain-containing protein [Roseisolibacter sp. H3M3-2]|uniref:lysylphosphatidylglycerol synthase transmembrane domain-containing protein n=1 Tax=Roseisolibacter sp. H3M3-2 TaxID=3031323 RepID=UPI0023DBF3B4|nr:lysylphosphatidylglycerol synthase transmembrane domain-containing protein [Roseisolibacter sp. H3M3-2]MDF1505978.1 lysylphosphatidylglycerol synthase transmembrane domain-containing protein [Roseisolibacter sp. H3M3-2]
MRFDWRSALGLALSALLLWWTLRGEPLGEVWAAVARSNWALLLFATALGTTIFPIRARKWRTILEPAAGVLPFGPLWRATAIGMMVNNVVPARAGELARAFALTREVPRVGFPASLASLAVDRVFDAIVLLLLMFGALLDPAFPPGVRVWGQSVPMLARGGALMVVVLLVGLYVFIAVPHLFEAAFRAVARRVLPRVEEAGARAVRTFADGLGALRHPGRFAAVFGWTLVHWLVHALALWLGFVAIGIDVPFSAALFLQGILGIAVAIPSSPGFFGVFEGAATVGLAVYGVDRTLAVSWALAYHLLSFIPITVMGAVYFARLGVKLRDVAAAPAAPAA